MKKNVALEALLFKGEWYHLSNFGRRQYMHKWIMVDLIDGKHLCVII